MKMKYRKLRRKVKVCNKFLKKAVQKEPVSDKVPEEKMEEIRKELSDRVLETARKQRARVAKTPHLR